MSFYFNPQSFAIITFLLNAVCCIFKYILDKLWEKCNLAFSSVKLGQFACNSFYLLNDG